MKRLFGGPRGGWWTETSSPRAAVGRGGERGGRSGRASVAGGALSGALGAGVRWPTRRSLPPPNNALEPTAPSGRLCPGGRLCVGAAAHRQRSAACQTCFVLVPFGVMNDKNWEKRAWH